MSEAFRRIREAWRHYGREGPPVVHLPDGNIEQRHHGTTQAALQAWMEVRTNFKALGVVAVGGVLDYPIVFSDVIITKPALYVEVVDDVVIRGMRRIYLTGCSWGYGGEGPHGTAVILADIDKTLTVAEALRWVASLPMDKPWRVEMLTEADWSRYMRALPEVTQ